MTRLRSLYLPLLLVAACGDNDSVTPPADADPAIDAAPAPLRAVVVTPSASFMSGQPGVLSAIDVEGATVMPNIGPAMAIGNDPVLRKIGGELLVVNRGTNNVTILDAADFSLVAQLPTGAGTNPQDVAVIDDKLFVATFGNKGMVELQRGFNTAIEIDLSVDDPDGKPNCNSVHRVNNLLYVSCELLDDTNRNLPPRGAGKVYVVDPSTRTITSTVTLTTKNPFNMLTRIPDHAPNAGDLVIGTIDFATGEGCLERIAVGGTPTAAGCVKTNAELGGYVARVDYYAPAFTGPVAPIVVPQMMWMVIGKPDFSTMVRAYNITGATLDAPISGATDAPLDLAACSNGDLIVTEAPFGGTGGVRIYRGGTQRTTEPLPVGLNPASTAGLACY